MHNHLDTLNGYFYYHNNSMPSISAVYKSFVFIMIALLLMVYHPRRFLHLLFFITVSVACLSYQLIIYEEIIESAAWVVRGLLTLALLFYIIGESRYEGIWKKETIVMLMFFYFLVMAINVLLGIFGLGEAQYSSGIGGKGYIIAGNEMSYLMLASASIILVYVAEKKRGGLLFIVFLVLLLFFLMKATKAAMLGIFLVYLCALIYNAYFKVHRLPAIYMLALIGGGAVTFLGYYFAQASGLLDRMLFLYILHDGFWGALLSGRVVFVQDAFHHVISNFGFFDVFFGVGVDQFRFITGSISEIDIVDVFVAFGVIGPLLFYFPWLLGAIWSFELMKSIPRHGFCFILLVIIIVGVSVTAGHVVNSGIASSTTAFFLAYLYIIKKNANS